MMVQVSCRRAAWSWAAGALLALGISSGAVAQPTALPPEQEFKVLFERVLREPANLDLSFRFAEVATALGDYEAAIGALERMLFYNPDLPRVKLELGVLYFRLGAYQMAQSYFSAALAAPDAPAEIRSRVAGFQTEIDRRLSTTQWSFYGQAGLRYQSNANAGPSNPFIRAIGLPAVLDRRFVRQPDWNGFVLGGFRHVYDFENQRGDVWETSVGAYYAAQFKFDRLNLGLVEAQTGPRLALSPEGWPGASIRPYVVGGFATLGDVPYLGSIGAGVSAAMPFGSTVLEPFLEVRERRFENSREYPLADQQSGQLWIAGALAQGHLWGPSVRWQARLAYAHSESRRNFYSYDQFSFDVAVPVEFDGPWGPRKWTVVPSIGTTQTDYDAPNPIIDPVVRRSDREWRAGVQLDMPVGDWLGLTAQVQYSSVESKLPNFDTQNLSVSFGPSVRF